MISSDLTTLLDSPDEAADWRQTLPSTPNAVAVVTGTFEILQPGNLATLQAAAACGGKMVIVVDEDSSPSRMARGGGSYNLPDRLAAVTFLKHVDAVAAGRAAEALAFFKALSPYTWVGHAFPDDGPISQIAMRQAASKKEVPFLSGCRTSDIESAAKRGATPVPIPSCFPTAAPSPVNIPTPAATVNGCFDVLHIGHLRFLDRAADFAGPVTMLVNSDASIRRYKGQGRPVYPFAFRRAALLALRAVTEVYQFEEDEPLALLGIVKPPLHIKGGSREPERVRHEEELLRRWGGRIEYCPLEEGYSTTAYLAKLHHPKGAP